MSYDPYWIFLFDRWYFNCTIINIEQVKIWCVCLCNISVVYFDDVTNDFCNRQILTIFMTSWSKYLVNIIYVPDTISVVCFDDVTNNFRNSQILVIFMTS